MTGEMPYCTWWPVMTLKSHGSSVCITGMEVTQAIFLVPLFAFFQKCGSTDCLLNTMFLFNRWHCSIAAVPPVKYECDSKGLSHNLAKSCETRGILSYMMLWPVMSWECKGPRHEQPWYKRSCSRMIWHQHQNGSCVVAQSYQTYAILTP